MSKEKVLQSKLDTMEEDIRGQEDFVEDLVNAITEHEAVNHAQFRDQINEAKDALDALEQDRAKAEEVKDKLEKLQGKREEVK